MTSFSHLWIICHSNGSIAERGKHWFWMNLYARPTPGISGDKAVTLTIECKNTPGGVSCGYFSVYIFAGENATNFFKMHASKATTQHFIRHMWSNTEGKYNHEDPFL